MSAASGYYDVAIVGGGLVGASLALALKESGLKLAVVEANASINLENFNRHQARSIALSHVSQAILANLGVWGTLAPYTEPIKYTEISDKGHFGSTFISASELQLDALGFSAPIVSIIYALEQAVKDCSKLHYFRPAKVDNINLEQHALHIKQEGKAETIHAELIIAADGAYSSLREQLHIPTKTIDYQQAGLLTNIKVSAPHNHTAYERFTSEGPIALLPIAEQTMALVWAVHIDAVDELCELSESDFLARLQTEFGYRAGKFLSADKLSAYPLKAMVAKEQVKPGFLLMGNAAHTLHPVAAQGFNLGLRDVGHLVDILQDAINQHQPIANEAILNQYLDKCRVDQNKTLAFTDQLLTIFDSHHFPMTPLRSFALASLNYVPPIKRQIARRAMGMRGRASRLAI